MRGYLVCLCIVLLLGRAAFADGDTATAKHHYETGTRAFNLGEFKTAAEEYRTAYKLKPEPSLLYNIAQAYRLDKNAEQALFFYRLYLHNAEVDSHVRVVVEARVRVLEEQLKQEQLPPNDVKPVDSHAATIEAKPIVTETSTRVEPPGGELVVRAPAPSPVYKKWWLWTAVGVVAVGVGLGVGLSLGLPPSVPGSSLGNHKVY